MSRIPAGILVWSLKRFTASTNLWDRVCFSCKQATPVFEHEHQDEQKRLLFHYLCEECAQKMLAEWLQDTTKPDDENLRINFDCASVFYEQKNDGETLQLIRWSVEQRKRRLQGEEK
ncbi:MAG TPA: hypothetical protein VL485_31635 [Ktedonobacteraceae bacterium]|jgi:hypothetical protein|nr:hypothetical protein [Ktedonobacteraceae bacterium]